MPLYDYIYIDLVKAASLYSQLTGGVIDLVERSTENGRHQDNKRHYDLKLFKHDAGNTTDDKTTSKEIVKPHHALIAELEDLLLQKGFMIDISKLDDGHSLKDPITREALKKSFCIKLTGRAVIEDYERIKSISSAFPNVIKIINKSAEHNIINSPQYAELQATIMAAEQEAKNTKDRNIRTQKLTQVKELRSNLNNTISSISAVQNVDQWILDGLRTWIDTFLPGIINIRVYPNGASPDEHVFGHLKQECFEEPNINTFHFSYGSIPTEDITIIGIVTSVPNFESDTFSPLSEFERLDLSDNESFENAFRSVFRGFDAMEQMIRTCRFPRILVHPLIVYRSVEPNLSFNPDATSASHFPHQTS